MHSNTYNFRPTDSVLDACQCVTIADPTVGSVREIKTWCWDTGLNLVWAEIMDTTDVSYQYDSVATFYFTTKEDVTMFRLKWL